MNIRQEGRYTEVFFNSIYEIEDAKVTEPTNARRQENNERNGSSGDTTPLDWWGVHGGYAAVKGFVSGGWRDGVEKAHAALEVLNAPRLKTIRRRKIRSDFGDHLDMQAVYGGNLDRAWESTHRDAGAMQQGQTVTLVVNLGAAWTVAAKDMCWKGAAATGLCDELQKSGRNVRIIGYTAQEGIYKNGGNKVVIVTLKEYQDVLNESIIAATTALAGFFRSYIFKALRVDESQVGCGRGRPSTTYKPKMLEEESDVYYINNDWSKEQAERLLNEEGTKVKGK